MKRFLTSCTALAAITLLLSQPLAAQDKEKDKDKSKASDNEEIIIKRKGDKNTKLTIEIKGDDITINGKPLAEFNDEDIVVRKQKSLYAPHSPFRGQSGTLNFSHDNNFLKEGAQLGVYTEKDKDVKGAIVNKVTEGSAADKAGLKENDVIKKIDNEDIDSPEELSKVIGKHKPEEKITITYERAGKSNKTEATLGKRRAQALALRSPQFDMDIPNFNFDWKDNDYGPRTFLYGPSSKPRLGIKAQDTEDGKGVKVLDVDDESAAEKAGIKEDDVITEFDGKKVNSAEELSAAAKEAKDKAAVKITFNRNGKSQTVEVKTP
ncbi:MAG TPA: PDZ domain-containing protein, partial [Niastella sp.]